MLRQEVSSLGQRDADAGKEWQGWKKVALSVKGALRRTNADAGRRDAAVDGPRHQVTMASMEASRIGVEACGWGEMN